MREITSVNDFRPGFRISVTDVIVLLLGIAAAIYAHTVYPLGSYIILCTVGHFFLFCNIVRMSRIPEIIWAAIFTGLMACNVIYGWPSGKIIAAATFLLTGTLVFLEIKKLSYHGIGWQYVNPNLQLWFNQQKGQ